MTKYAQAVNNRLMPRLTAPKSNTIGPISWKLEAGSWKLEAEPTHMHMRIDQHVYFFHPLRRLVYVMIHSSFI